MNAANDKAMQLFAARLRSLMQDRNLSQSDLARRVKVTPQSVQRWCAAASYPRPAMVKELADALGVSVAQLTDGIPDNLRAQPAAAPGLQFALAQEQADSASDATLPQLFQRYHAAHDHYMAARRHRAKCHDTLAAELTAQLIDQLGWLGYNTDDIPPGVRAWFPVTAEDSPDAAYASRVVLTAPSPSDVIGLRAHEGVTGYLAYPIFGLDSTEKVSWLMLPAYYLQHRDAEHYLAMRAAVDWLATEGRMPVMPRGWFNQRASRNQEAPTGESPPALIVKYLDNFELKPQTISID